MADKKKFPLFLVACIVPQNKADNATEIMTNLGVTFQIATLAENKQVSGISDLLGMVDDRTSFVAGVCVEEQSHNVIKALCRNLELYKGNNGIAFSVPINAISREDLNNVKKGNKEIKGENNETNIKAKI